jgi:hypothetical protein
MDMTRVRAARARATPITDLVLIPALYLIYSEIGSLATGRASLARAHSALIVRLTPDPVESLEAHLRALLVDHHSAQLVANVYYSVLHLTVTAGVLLWAWWRHPDEYRTYRWVLGAVTASALLFFWLFPVAPPRLNPTLAFLPAVQDQAGEPFMNPFAAFPSLHLAWAAWCAWVITRHHRSRLASLVWLYPVATAVVLVATANHFTVDLVGGAVVLSLTVGIAGWRGQRRSRPEVGEEPGSGAAPETDSGAAQPAGRATPL